MIPEYNIEKNFASTGSFNWLNLTDEAKLQAKAMSSVAAYKRFLNEIKNASVRLAGDGVVDSLCDRYFFKDSDIKDEGKSILFNEDVKIDTITVPYPNVTTLHHEKDFVIQNGRIRFKSSIKKLFDTNRFFYWTGVYNCGYQGIALEKCISPLNYLCSTNDVNYKDFRFVSQYVKSKQSPGMFELMLNIALNIPLVHEGGNLKTKEYIDGVWIYTFDTGEVIRTNENYDVDPEYRYTRNEPIKKFVKVFTNNGNEGWYRSSGIKSLSFNSNGYDITVDAVNSNLVQDYGSGSTHIYGFDVGLGDDNKTFWSKLQGESIFPKGRTQPVKVGDYLKTQLNQQKAYSGVDLLFRISTLGDTAMIVAIDESKKDYKQYIEFLVEKFHPFGFNYFVEVV